MACSYKFNGKEFKNKEEIKAYIQNNIEEIPNDVILELLDTASENALFPEKEAKLFEGSNFTNISEDGFSSMDEPITYEYVKAMMEKERNAKLKSIAPRLTDFANSLGVSVEFIKENGIEGVARIADGVIAISIGEQMTDSYYEEMSHMLRERFKDRLSNEDLSNFVKSSKEYAKYSDEYRMVYQSEGLKNEALERKVELEIFDKILASELRRALNDEPSPMENQGDMWGTIKQWVMEFLEWAVNIGGRDARNMIRDIIKAVNSKDLAKFSNKNYEFQSYYRLGNPISPEMKSVSNDIIANLKNAIASIRSIHGSEAVVNIIENQIYGFGDGNGVETNKMLDSFISSTYRMLDDIDREIEDLYKEASVIEKKDLALISFFVSKIPEQLPLVKKSILSGKLMGVKSKREKDMMANKVDELAANISRLKEKYDKYATDFILKKIDEDQKLIGTSQDVIDQMKSSVQDGIAKDIGYAQRWLFSGYSSSSSVDAMFQKLRLIMQNDYQNDTTNAIAEISQELDKLGITIEQFNSLIEMGKDGRTTGYVISPYMRDVIADAEITMIASEIDPSILDRETIKSIRDGETRLSELTEQQRELYQYAWNKVNNEITEKPFTDEYYQGKDSEMEANIRAVFPSKTNEEVKRLKKAISIKTSPLYSKKAQIMAKYIKKSQDETRLRILEISHSDKLEIDAIDAQLKFLSQTYNEMGGVKEGEAQEISQVLRYSLENYKGQEEDANYTAEYSQYLDDMEKVNLSIYQILKATGSISFSEDDSINTALHELGTYEIFKDSAVLQMINAYLPDGNKLIINTPSQLAKKTSSGDIIFEKQSLTEAENQAVKDAISTLKEIRKSMLSPYKKFGELRIGAGGLSDTTLAESVKLEQIFRIIKGSQILSEEEKATIKEQEIGFIPTDNFYRDYGYVEVNSIKEIEESLLRIDDSERPITYVLTTNGGIQEYYKKDANQRIYKIQPSDAELTRKEKFERKHMEVLPKSKKMVPKFYYTKVVNERKVVYFDGENPTFRVASPQEKVVYISEANGKHYNFDKKGGKFVEVAAPDKTKGQRYVTYGGKTFLVNIKPNSIWKGKTDASKYINPNYNETIGRKAKQYKKVINVNGKPTSTLSNEYFNKFGISKDNIWGEATANRNLFQAMRIVLDNDQARLKRIGIEQDYFYRPQVRIKPDELLYTKGGVKNAAKAWMDTNIFSNIQDVDTMASVNTDKKISIKEGKQRNQLMDNYNVRISPDVLTNNLLASYFTRTEMAIRFDVRAKNLVQADMLMNMAKEIEYAIDESNTKKGDSSNVYGAMQDNYVSDLFGGVHGEIGTVRIGDKMVSGTKTIQTLRRYLVTKALGFNKYTAISSAISGWVGRQKESFIGQYGTREDYKFASDTISYMDMSKDFGNKISKEKIIRMAEFMGIVDFKDMLARASRHKNINKITSALDPFSFLRAGDVGRIAESVVIGLLQFRKIDGRWYSRDNFLEKSVNSEKKTMDEANMIWDANQKNALYHEVMKYYDEDKKTLRITSPKIKALFDNASGIAQKHHTDLTGSVKGVDSPTAFRKPLAAPLGMFKNFLINVLQNRFHESIPGNQYTGGNRKGSYRYVQMNQEWAKLLAYAIMNMQSKINDPNNGLTYQEMQALRRIQMDTYASLSFLAIAMVLTGMADDDEYEDVWIVQAAAYAAAKTFTEVSSGDIYSLPNQGLEIIKSPYVSFTRLTDDVGNLTFGGEDVRQGTYKGYDKRLASAIKLSPMGLANLYNIIGDDAEASRRYLYKDRWVWDAYKAATEE